MAFKKGQSGNPAGRPPNRNQLIKRLAEEGLIDAAIKTLKARIGDQKVAQWVCEI